MREPVDLEGHDRVRDHTANSVNEQIDDRTVASIVHLAKQGPNRMLARLAKLDREWDIDRALMASFAVLGGGALGLGIHRYAAAGRKTLLYLLGAQFGFLLMHATVGWCPPASVLRRLGFRTQREIEFERHAVRAIVAGHQPTL
jgi:hypothetical protein